MRKNSIIQFAIFTRSLNTPAVADIIVRYIEISILRIVYKVHFPVKLKSFEIAEQSIALMTSIERIGFSFPHYWWTL